MITSGAYLLAEARVRIRAGRLVLSVHTGHV